MTRSSQAPSSRPTPSAPAPISFFTWLASGPVGGLMAVLILVLSVVAVYHGTLEGPFILDDPMSLLGNPTIHQVWPLSGPLHPPPGDGQTVEGRPLLNLSFALNYHFTKDSPAGYRATNIGIHACAALLLFGILRRTFRRIGFGGRDGPAGALGLALGCALLWAVHPLQTESVSYIVQRAESLMGLFYLLTLYAFVRAVEEKPAAQAEKGAAEAGTPIPRSLGRACWMILAVAACALGMATKEVMVSAPLLILLYDRTFVAGTFDRAFCARRWAYAALFLTWLLLGHLVIPAWDRGMTIGPGSGMGHWGYALCQARGLILYLRLCFVPVGQIFDYGPDIVAHWTDVLPHGLAVIALLGVTGWALCGGAGLSGRHAAYLGAWFFLILAPTSSFVGGLRQMLAEHRMYLPLAAVVVLSAAGLRALLGVRGTIAALLVLSVPLAIVSYFRNNLYTTAMLIYGDTVAKRPSNPWAHCNNGYAIGTAGHLDAAVDEFKEAIRLKDALPQPNLLPEAYYNLGVVYVWKNRLPEALKEFEAAVILRPGYPDALRMMGIVLVNLGHPAAALPFLDHLNRSAPTDSLGWYAAGLGYLALGRNVEAAQHFERSIRLNPNNPDTWLQLGVVAKALGRLDDAIPALQNALVLRSKSGSNFPEANYNLGLVFGMKGRLSDALAQFQAALAARPNYPEAMHMTGMVLTNLGHAEDALKYLTRLNQVSPMDAGGWLATGLAYLNLSRNEEAAEAFNQSVRLDPKNPETSYELGLALRGLGRREEAVDQFRKALALRPDFPQANYDGGSLIAALGNAQEGLALVERAVDEKPDYIDARLNKATILCVLGRLPEAVEEYHRILALNPGLPEAHARLGRVLMDLNRPAEAAGEYEEALRYRPGYTEAQKGLDAARLRQSGP